MPHAIFQHYLMASQSRDGRFCRHPHCLAAWVKLGKPENKARRFSVETLSARARATHPLRPNNINLQALIFTLGTEWKWKIAAHAVIASFITRFFFVVCMCRYISIYTHYYNWLLAFKLKMSECESRISYLTNEHLFVSELHRRIIMTNVGLI